MNHLIVEKVVYRFQDLVSEKKVKTFTKFLSEVFFYFKISDVNRISHKFIYKELKNIHVFLKEIQHHPSSVLLAQALKPLFEFLLNNLIIPKVVFVVDREYFQGVKIKYSHLILAARRKRIIQVGSELFVIPYKGSVPRQLREEKVLPYGNWAFSFVTKTICDKVELSLVKYGDGVFNPGGVWSEEQTFEFGLRLAGDYINSDFKYLPREIFDFGNLDPPDIPEGH